jgi:hypothetical protein
MQNKRVHARFDLIDLQGKMILANKVEIVDISLGGVALKVDRKLDIGREYMVKLGDKNRSIDVKGVVVRATLVGMEAGPDEEGILTYAVGMKFKEGSEEKITAFLNSVEHRTKTEKAPMAERRSTVRFQITAPQEKLLAYPSNFKVKDITLSSMLIYSDQPLEKESMIPMEVYLNDSNQLNFTGKIFSNRKVEDQEQVLYEIVVTYSDLSEKDRALLKKFIDYLVSDTNPGKP